MEVGGVLAIWKTEGEVLSEIAFKMFLTDFREGSKVALSNSLGLNFEVELIVFVYHHVYE